MRKDLRTVLYTRRLPDKPKQVEGSYSIYGVRKQWGSSKLKELLNKGEVQIGYYEWLELAP